MELENQVKERWEFLAFVVRAAELILRRYGTVSKSDGYVSRQLIGYGDFDLSSGVRPKKEKDELRNHLRILFSEGRSPTELAFPKCQVLFLEYNLPIEPSNGALKLHYISNDVRWQHQFKVAIEQKRQLVKKLEKFRRDFATFKRNREAEQKVRQEAYTLGLIRS